MAPALHPSRSPTRVCHLSRWTPMPLHPSQSQRRPHHPSLWSPMPFSPSRSPHPSRSPLVRPHRPRLRRSPLVPIHRRPHPAPRPPMRPYLLRPARLLICFLTMPRRSAGSAAHLPTKLLLPARTNTSPRRPHDWAVERGPVQVLWITSTAQPLRRHAGPIQVLWITTASRRRRPHSRGPFKSFGSRRLHSHCAVDGGAPFKSFGSLPQAAAVDRTAAGPFKSFGSRRLHGHCAVDGGAPFKSFGSLPQAAAVDRTAEGARSLEVLWNYRHAS